MEARDLSLSPRMENVREIRHVEVPVHFSCEEILSHFNESMTQVREKLAVANQVLVDGDE